MKKLIQLLSLNLFVLIIGTSCNGTTGLGFADGDDDPKPKKQRGYEMWQHGAAKKERKGLGEEFNTKVDGNTHESEHPIGMAVLLASQSNLRGKNPDTRRIENCAPAYQEFRPLHRAHIGTGTKNEIDGSGFNSHSYRETLKVLIEDAEPAAAIQINQLCYAFDPEFRGDSVDHQVAEASFNNMASTMKEFPRYDDGGTEVAVAAVTDEERLEMLVARHVARTGKYPTEDEMEKIKGSLKDAAE